MDARLLLALVSMLALLSGCAEQPQSLPVADALPPEVLERQAVDVQATSSLYVCPGCIGIFGSDVSPVGGPGAIVALDVDVLLDDDPVSQALGALAQVRATAFCLGERLTCPQGPLATAEGLVPLTLKADGFRIAAPDELAFRIEYLGPGSDPVNGSGASYRIVGEVTAVVEPVASEDDA